MHSLSLSDRQTDTRERDREIERARARARERERERERETNAHKHTNARAHTHTAERQCRLAADDEAIRLLALKFVFHASKVAGLGGFDALSHHQRHHLFTVLLPINVCVCVCVHLLIGKSTVKEMMALAMRK